MPYWQTQLLAAWCIPVDRFTDWNLGNDGIDERTCVESISTENTRAPSFASSAARGRPTTSDLVKQINVSKEKENVRYSSPVNNGDSLPICSITIRQDSVIDPDMFETFDDGQRCTRNNGLHRAGRGLIIRYWDRRGGG